MSRFLDNQCEELGVAVRAIVEALDLSHATAGECLMTAAVFELRKGGVGRHAQLLHALTDAIERCRAYEKAEADANRPGTLHS